MSKVTHSNNAMAKSASETLSRMEEFPVIITTVTREEAAIAYLARSHEYCSIAGVRWFKSQGIAYRVTNEKHGKVYHVMSFYNNTHRGLDGKMNPAKLIKR